MRSVFVEDLVPFHCDIMDPLNAVIVDTSDNSIKIFSNNEVGILVVPCMNICMP